MLGEQALADPVGQRCDLEQLVVRQELDGIVQRQIADAVEPHGDIRGAAPNVGEVLLADDVHLEVAVADVLPHDHSLVHIDPGTDEEGAAILGRIEAERGGRAGLEGDERAVGPRLDRAGVGPVVREQRVHDPLASRAREEGLAEAEQAAGRDPVHAVGRAVVAVLHVDEHAAAAASELDHGPEQLLAHLDLEHLVRLVPLPVDLLEDDLGA